MKTLSKILENWPTTLTGSKLRRLLSSDAETMNRRAIAALIAGSHVLTERHPAQPATERDIENSSQQSGPLPPIDGVMTEATASPPTIAR
jgi:hypothetical protein